MKHLVVRATAVTALLAGAACGLPEDDRPRVIAAEDAPLALEPTTTTSAPATGTQRIDVWLVDAEGTLVAVERGVQSPVSVQLALDALLAAPSEEEDATLDTFIPEGTALAATMAEAGVAVVQLGAAGTGLLSIQGGAQLNAFAQIVTTATEIEGVDAVRFVLEDGVTAVPAPTATGEGNVERPVTATDYIALRR